ncbi:MAG: dihydropteroate synthase [Ignavibacteriae bacterium]|nr:dihydropteroate synthase [Ignavibacteriota bacterium]
MSFVFRFAKRTYDLSSRTHVMGILNVTPDSFSDGGKYIEPDQAVARGLHMIDEGADFIDVGGESTRPKSTAYGEGAEPVSVEQELRRVLPVIEMLATQTDIPISIDTYKSEVAAKAIEAGATIVNDISGFQFDPQMPHVVARGGASAVLMHIKGTPKTMQQNPMYDDLLSEISSYLERGITLARQHNIGQIIIDPGIGFGKALKHNLSILKNLNYFSSLGCPILVGVSQKSFIGTILDQPAGKRTEGSLAAAVVSILHGAHIVRVHDVRETVSAVRIADAIQSAGDM